MHRFAKILLLYMLMLAAPLQGFAAASGIPCGPGQQHALSTDAENPHAAHRVHAHHAVDEQTDNSTDIGDTPLAASTCSSCASCCVGAFIPPSALDLAAVEHARIAEPPVPASHDSGYIPEGLKRPPRSLLS